MDNLKIAKKYFLRFFIQVVYLLQYIGLASVYLVLYLQNKEGYGLVVLIYNDSDEWGTLRTLTIIKMIYKTVYCRSMLPNTDVFSYAWHNAWERGGAARTHNLANAGYKVSPLLDAQVGTHMSSSWIIQDLN